MNFIKEETYVKNIFNIDDNVFNISKIIDKKVKINNTCSVILIPDRNEIDNDYIKYDIWYSVHELKLIRDSHLCELTAISRINGINMKDALTIWKENN
jgi:hypothetical protein